MSHHKTASLITLNQSESKLSPLQRFLTACQEGDYNTVKELVENGSVDVNDHLDDQISGLHWAAINNKLSICRYLVSKGAHVDYQGGDLNATPLHWASRYGLVYIVDFLLQNGADGKIRDAQGFNCLHLAVHSSNIMLVIYMLLMTDIEVDSEDPNERTALHWAAYQGDALSVEVLLKFGADVNRTDNAGFTALHWSLVNANSLCLKALIKSDQDTLCDIFATTNDGKTTFDVAIDMGHLKVFQDVLKVCGKDAEGRDLVVPEIFTSNPKLPKVITFLVPYVVIGLTLEFFSDYYNIFQTVLFDTLLFVMAYYFLRKVVFPGYIYEKVYINSPLLAGIFSSCAFWVIINWLFYVLPNTIDNHLIPNIFFSLFSSLVVFFFFKTMFLNPGMVKPYVPKRKTSVKIDDSDDENENNLVDVNEEFKNEVIEGVRQLVKSGKFDSKNFCYRTFVRRPLRSKYSHHSQALVARFDHFCPWVYNDIGLRNHKFFMFFLISLTCSIGLFTYLSIQYFNYVSTFAAQFVYSHDRKLRTVKRPPHTPFQVYDPTPNNKCSILSSSWCNGWSDSFPLFVLNAFILFQGLWVSILIVSQLYLVSKNLTSYEQMVARKPFPEYYASPVPIELLTEFENPIVGNSSMSLDGATLGDTTEEANSEVNLVENEPRDVFKLKYLSRAFMPCLKVIGIAQFVDMFRKKERSPNHFNFGTRVNCAEFWCLGNTSKSKFNIRNFFRIQAPDNGETYIGEQLVDYYKLYDYPIRRMSYKELV